MLAHTQRCEWSIDTARSQVRTKGNYTNRSAKRLFRGEGATPVRIEKMGLKADRSAGGANAWM